MPPRKEAGTPAAPSLPVETAGAASPRLQGSVTAAAVLLLIFGTLGGLGSVFTLFAAVLLSAVPYAMPFQIYAAPTCPYGGSGIACHLSIGGPWEPNIGAFWWVGIAFVALAALVGAVVAGGHLTAGVAILKRRGWGRILGMVVSGTALIIVVMAFASLVMSAMVPLPRGYEFSYLGYDKYTSVMAPMIAFGVVFGGLMIVAYGYILWVLARRGDFFE